MVGSRKPKHKIKETETIVLDILEENCTGICISLFFDSKSNE